MAVVRKNPKASIRFANDKQRTIQTYSGVKPDVTTDAVIEFASAIEIFRGSGIAFKYLNVTTELEESL